MHYRPRPASLNRNHYALKGECYQNLIVSGIAGH
jgi:hypothetical protein